MGCPQVRGGSSMRRLILGDVRTYATGVVFLHDEPKR
jgi:hypothetical protein